MSGSLARVKIETSSRSWDIIAVQLGKDRESFLRICGGFYDVAKLSNEK